VPTAAVFTFETRRYVPLSALKGAAARVEARTQRLLLDVPAELFPATALQLNGPGTALPPRPGWSAFANYDLFGFASQGTGYGSGLFELGTAGPYGSGIVSLLGNTSEQSGVTRGMVVLDTTWRYDDPAGLRTVLLGDSISTPGAWSRPLRVTGLQIGTNFTLQPDLITYPLQAFSGTAVVPSTVDVFVNGSKVGSQQVQAGAFAINNVPVVTGSGSNA